MIATGKKPFFSGLLVKAYASSKTTFGKSDPFGVARGSRFLSMSDTRNLILEIWERYPFNFK